MGDVNCAWVDAGRKEFCVARHNLESREFDRCTKCCGVSCGDNRSRVCNLQLSETRMRAKKLVESVIVRGGEACGELAKTRKPSRIQTEVNRYPESSTAMGIEVEGENLEVDETHEENGYERGDLHPIPSSDDFNGEFSERGSHAGCANDAAVE